MLIELEKIENIELERQRRQAVKDIADTLFLDFLINQRPQGGIRFYQRVSNDTLPEHLLPETASLIKELGLSDPPLVLTVIGSGQKPHTYEFKPIEEDQKPLELPPGSYLAILENHENTPSSRLWMLLTPSYDPDETPHLKFGVDQNLPGTNLLQIETFRSKISGSEARPLLVIGFARNLEDSLRRIFRARPESFNP